MKQIAAMIFVVAGALALAGCTATERGAAIGAGTGAVIGGATTGTVQGAAVGAGIGGVSGAVIGELADRDNKCVYETRDGRQYVADCPADY